jgi:hypothetical protein
LGTREYGIKQKNWIDLWTGIVINFRLIALIKGGNMKAIFLSILLIAIIILINCSSDRVVVDPILADNDITNSLNMTEDPGPQYPPEYGLNEFTPPFMLNITIGIIWDPSYSYRMVIAVADIIDFYGRLYTNPGIEVNFEIIPDSIAAISSPVYTNEWGSAIAKLEYPPVHAFEEIQLIASCHQIADTITVLLPILTPELELSANPQRLRVVQPGVFDTSIVACRLSDGMGNFIGGGRILFTALVAGEICGPTSVYTDDHGWARTQYRIRFEDIPDTNTDPNLLETGVRATLFGYPDAEEEISIFCARP